MLLLLGRALLLPALTASSHGSLLSATVVAKTLAEARWQTLTDTLELLVSLRSQRLERLALLLRTESYLRAADRTILDTILKQLYGTELVEVVPA